MKVFRSKIDKRTKARLNGAHRGFTLLELLVATGVIMILAGIAITVLPGVIERSRNSKCTMHLRQLHMALELYTQEHDGKYPSSMASGKLWHPRLAPYLDVTIQEHTVAGAPPCQDTPFLCPNAQFDTEPRRSYALNSRFNDNNLLTDDLKISIQQPQNTAIMGDGLHTSWMQSTNNLSFRHEGGYANVLFADGHVESLTKEEASEKNYTIFISGK